jgi:hypothetical protein
MVVSTTRISTRKAATCEDVEDPRDKATQGLSDGVDVIILSESEFQSLSKGGEMEGLKMQSQQRREKEQQKNTLVVKEPKRVSLGERRKPNKRQGIDITGECQSTSLKVKVEDLVIDKVEKRGQHEKLWDRPIPPPEPQWIRDPRLPTELNEMNVAMWDYNWPQFTPAKEEYRLADTHEISSTMEFIAYAPNRKPRKKEHRLTLPTIDKLMEAIRRLKGKYEPHRRTNEVGTNEKERSHKGKERMKEPSEEEMTNLRQGWYDKYQNILQGVSKELPPLRDVNHKIILVNSNKRYMYYLPRYPVTVRKEFQEKLNRYVNAGWWVPVAGIQAPPLMCVPKKDGRLRTVIDARQQIDNTVKDLTPLPDQEVIHEDVARGRYRSKIDLVDAYEQV